MADINQKATIDLAINGERARNELATLKDQAAQLKSEIQKVKSAEGELDKVKLSSLQKDLRKTNSEIRTIENKFKDVESVLKNMSGATPKELSSAIKTLTKRLNSGEIERGSEKWKQITATIKKLKTELASVNNEMKEHESFLSRFNNGLSRWGGMIASAAATLTGVAMTLSTIRKNRDEKDAARAQLKSLTGLDDASIEWLKGQAEQLSTTMDQTGLRIQQSSAKILEAYMLVGSKKPELLKSKEELNAVTIEAMRLASAAGINLDDAVNATTVSLNMFNERADQAGKYVNVLAAGSKVGAAAVASQAAAIVNSGVAAYGAGLSIEQLDGTIQMLAEKGIEAEKAGTALRKFFLVLQTGADDTNPKIVGYQQALENLNKKGLSAAQTQKMFGEEAYSAASILIQNSDKVAEYTRLITNTSTATEQAAINSDTYQAKMAQLKNKLKEAGIELMDKLNPSLSLVTGWTAKLIKAAPVVIDFIQKNKGAIMTLTGAITALYLVRQKDVMWAKMQILWNEKIVGSTLKLFNLIKTNPWSAALMVITAVGIAIYKFATRVSEAEQAVRNFRKENMKEQTELSNLVRAIKDANVGTERRANLIKEFNSKYGNYLSNLLSEKSTIKELAKAYQEASIAIQNKIAQQKIEEAKTNITNASVEDKAESLQNLQDILRKKLPASDVNKIRNTLIEYIQGEVEKGFSSLSIIKRIKKSLKDTYHVDNQLLSDINSDLFDYVNQTMEDFDKIQEVERKFGSLIYNAPKKKNTAEIPEVVVTAPSRQQAAPTDEQTQKKELNRRLDALETELAKERALYTALYATGKINKLEFDSFLEKTDQEFLQKKRQLYAAGSKEYEEITTQMYEKQIKAEMDSTSQTLETVEKGIAERKNILIDARADERITQEAFDEGMFNLEVELFQRKIAILKQHNQEYAAIQEQLDNLVFKRQIERKEQFQESLKNFLQKYGAESLKKEKELLLKEVKKLLSQHLLKETQGLIESINDDFEQQAVQKVLKLKAPQTSLGLFDDLIKTRKMQLDALQQFYEEGLISYKTFLDTKGELTKRFIEGVTERLDTCYTHINSILNAYNAYNQASMQVEIAQIEKKYDKQLEAAKNNSVLTTQIEKKKEKEIADIKTKHNKKATTIQIAQALAETALGALKAYTSAWTLGPVLGPIYGPIFAAMATAAGMLQVAAIKKQAEAQSAGYAKGGFTPSGAWDEPQGVVHSDEFVANRFAVRNPAIRPVLQLIDTAQRNNTIASLRSEDVAMALHGYSGHNFAPAPEPTTPSAIDTTAPMIPMVNRLSSCLDRLNEKLDDGINSYVVLDGERGLDRKYKHYQQLQKNKER